MASRMPQVIVLLKTTPCIHSQVVTDQLTPSPAMYNDGALMNYSLNVDQ
jgi:hypothetical protein